MNLFAKTLGLILGLALLALLGGAAYLALDFLAGLFASLDAQVARVTAIGSLVALAASLIVSASIRAAGRRSQTLQVHGHKTSTYQMFADVWAEGGAPEKVRVLERLLALHGGPEVVQAHLALRTVVREKGWRHGDAAAALGKALMAIRKDLGTEVRPRGLGAEPLQQLLLATAQPVPHA